MGLTPDDVGRQFVRLNLKVKPPHFETMMLEVLRDGVARQREFKHEKTLYRLRATPYKTSDEHVEGVVAAFFDITDVKAPANALQPKGRKTDGHPRHRT
jgi:two-component system, chemotaxis family, CheB/CheR fusion protein